MTQSLSSGAIKSITIDSIFTSSATFFVRIRFIAQWGNLKQGGHDDVVIFVAMLMAFTLFAMDIAPIWLGLGYHAADLNHDEIKQVLKYLFAAILPYTIILTFTKISLLLRYKRLFPGRYTRMAIWCTLVLVIVYGIQSIFVRDFACSPLSDFWNLKTTSANHCTGHGTLWFFNAEFNILTDIMIIAIPIPVISSLRLSLSLDPTYDIANVSIWSAIEVNMHNLLLIPNHSTVLSRLSPKFFVVNSNTYEASIPPPVKLWRLEDNLQTRHIIVVGAVRPQFRSRDNSDVNLDEESGRGKIFVTTSVDQDLERARLSRNVGSENTLIPVRS